jgi:hypothetical protein
MSLESNPSSDISLLVSLGSYLTSLDFVVLYLFSREDKSFPGRVIVRIK